MSMSPRPQFAQSLSAFDHHPRSRVIFGTGTIQRLGALVRELGGTRVLLVTDPGLEEAGHPQRAMQSLLQEDIHATVFDAVEQNPTARHVEVGLALAKDHAIDFLVAVGGGSSMDCAKGVNFLLTNGGRMADYQGFGKADKPMLPSIAVPTTAGTGSEAQSYALIADERTHMKMACGDPKAAFRIAILDPEVTVSQPPKVTAVTGIDAIAHALESYVCTKRGPISSMYARTAWELLESNFERVLREPDNLEARGAMQLGANFAGTAIENAMLGVCHACANPLTAHYGIIHGMAIGIMLPHVIRFNLPVAGNRYAHLVNDADGLVQRIHELVVAAGLPRSLTECGVEPGILPVLAAEANDQWTARFNPRPASESDILQLYEAAL